MQLPQGWALKSLGELGECIIGLTYRPENVVTDNGTLVLRSSNVQDGRLSFHDNVFVNNNIPDRLQARIGDILVCVRNGSRSLIGKSAVIEPHHLKAKLTFGAFMSVYRTPYFDYIRHLFDSEMYYDQIKNNLGATINQITNKNLNGFTFPFPCSEHERNKIADVISTVNTRIDLLTQKIIESENFKVGLIQKLFSEGFGILDSNRNWQAHTEFKSSVFGKIPSSWNIAKLGEHAIKVGSGVTPKGGSKAYVNHGIPLLRSQNILFGKLKLDDVAFITETQHEKMKGSQLQPRDILLNITGASIGRCAVLPDDFLEGNVNQHVCIIRTTSSLLPEFGGIFLNSHFGQKQIWNLQAGGNREGLNFQQIRSFDIPLPPINEQKEIVEICNTIDSKIRLLEQQKSETQLLKKGLMQKLLTGEWRVPLDCNEEEAA